MRDGELMLVPVAANTLIHLGAIVVANAGGYAQPGSTATGLTYLGRADGQSDNTGGADGDKLVPVRRKKAFKFANSGTDPVGQDTLGKTCWIEDDETVAGTDGDTGTGATRSPAGTVLAIDADGVWIE